FFVRLRGRPGFQPVKDVRSLERAIFRETIGGGISRGGGDGFLTLINRVNLRGAGPRGVQRESAQESETIEHLTDADQFGDTSVIHLLIQVESGFLPAQQVHFKLQTVQAYLHQRGGSGQLAGEDSVGLGQSFESPCSNVVPFEDRPRREACVQRG